MLVDDEQRIILEDYVERHGLRLCPDNGLGYRVEFDGLTALHLVAGPPERAIDPHCSIE